MKSTSKNPSRMIFSNLSIMEWGIIFFSSLFHCLILTISVNYLVFENIGLFLLFVFASLFIQIGLLFPFTNFSHLVNNSVKKKMNQAIGIISLQLVIEIILGLYISHQIQTSYSSYSSESITIYHYVFLTIIGIFSFFSYIICLQTKNSVLSMLPDSFNFPSFPFRTKNWFIICTTIIHTSSILLTGFFILRQSYLGAYMIIPLIFLPFIDFLPVWRLREHPPQFLIMLFQYFLILGISFMGLYLVTIYELNYPTVFHFLGYLVYIGIISVFINAEHCFISSLAINIHIKNTNQVDPSTLSFESNESTHSENELYLQPFYCPTCRSLVESPTIEYLSHIDSIFCSQCGTKIHIQEVYSFSRQAILEEHQHILNRIKNLGNLQSKTNHYTKSNE